MLSLRVNKNSCILCYLPLVKRCSKYMRRILRQDGASVPLCASFVGYMCRWPQHPFGLSMACYASRNFIVDLVLSKCEISVAASLFSASYLLTVLMGIVIFKSQSALRMIGFLMIMGFTLSHRALKALVPSGFVPCHVRLLGRPSVRPCANVCSRVG